MNQLDAIHSKKAYEIMELLNKLNRSEGLTIILTTNNKELSEFDCNTFEMVDGTILKE